MDLNIFVNNVYIILLLPAYKNITFYGSSKNSDEILTNWLINVGNFVHNLIYKYICKYIYMFFYKEVGRGGRGAFAMFWGGLTPLKFGKLWFKPYINGKLIYSVFR